MSRKLGIKLEDIIKLHNEGLNSAEIAEKLGGKSGNILARLKKAGIKIVRDYSKTRKFRNNRIHRLNEDFFEFIDNEDKAYFLGLMYSDGSVSKDQFYIKLKDEDIILKFKEALKCDYDIKRNYYEGYDSYKMTIFSNKLCSDLIKLGCVPNKTRVIRMPELREDLIRHFIRGFFDGDGCLQLQAKLATCRFDIVSAAKPFLEDIRPIITKHGKSNGYLGKESKYDIWHLNYTGSQVIQILDWLYEDSNFYLKRKHDKYLILKNNYSSSKIG